MEEKGLTFYSEKCGPEASQVKSCARPTCVALEDPPPSCQASDQSKPKNAVPVASRETASLPRGPEIGTIKLVEGPSWIEMPDGNKEAINEGSALHERDTVITEKSGRVQVEFKDGNLVQIQNNTAVKIDQYEMAAEKRKAVLELMRGQIRNQVKQKYNGETSSYQIRTKTAVAGVRGTDFVASYKEGEKVETEIRTIEGKVVLASPDYSQSLEIKAGEQAAYVVAANDVFNQDEINEFVARGYMTPVYKMSEAEIRKLERGTLVAGRKRDIASSQKICREPRGELNQCAWRCVNNPRGEKACRTDLENVSCVRSRCNANGVWAEETRLPASLKQTCEASEVKVGPCDY